MNEVIAADAQGIAVAGNDPNAQVGPCQLQTRGHSGRTTVDRVNSISVDVVRKSTAASNSRYKNGLFRGHAYFR